MIDPARKGPAVTWSVLAGYECEGPCRVTEKWSRASYSGAVLGAMRTHPKEYGERVGGDRAPT